ncbi:MAG: FHA domain-containing protein [Chloroflexota bacterium]
MDDLQIDIMVMSGVDDGLVMSYSTANGDGVLDQDEWVITLGRRDDNDLCLRNDTFSSRYHARLYWRGESWWLEDCNSKNGSFVEEDDEDARVSGMLELGHAQLFRVGRTWLRIQSDVSVASEGQTDA